MDENNFPNENPDKETAEQNPGGGSYTSGSYSDSGTGGYQPHGGGENASGGYEYRYSNGTVRREEQGGYRQDYRNGNPNGSCQQGYQQGNPNGSCQQGYQNYGGYQQPPKKSNAGLAVASLVLGIISVVLMCGPNLVTGALGIIFGALYLWRGERERRKMAVAGLVLSIIGAAVIILVFVIAVFRTFSIYNAYSSYFY